MALTDRPMPRIGVLISGRGSNLQALIDSTARGALRATLAVVISNNDDAPGIGRATEAGIETLVVSHRAYKGRVAFDRALVRALLERGVELVCLAGFMRLLGTDFCSAFPNRVLNIHPSLLPAFPGMDAQAQAIRHGVKVSGATVHLVTPELDAGPIVQQAAVPVHDDDSLTSLAARILEVEHVIYPQAVERLLHESWRLDGRRVVFAASRSTPVE